MHHSTDHWGQPSRHPPLQSTEIATDQQKGNDHQRKRGGLKDLRGDIGIDRLQQAAQRFERGKQVGPKHHAERVPASENHNGERDPAHTGGVLVAPSELDVQ